MWPRVKLGAVLSANQRNEVVDAVRSYRLLGVRLNGQGPFLRETVLGTQTAAKQLFRVAAGDFIYSRLFACRGAFGVIESEFDGCSVSAEFPTFTAARDKLDPYFLKYWFRLPSVIARVNEDCTGSTPLTRNRFKERFFLALDIPLPPLAEQRRIVVRIKELAARIDDASAIRNEATVEAEAFSAAASSMLLYTKDAKNFLLRDLIGAAGLRNGKSVKSNGSSSEIRCLTLASMRNGEIDLSASKPIPMSRGDAVPYLVKKGDVFIVRGNGSKELCGRAGIVLEDSKHTIFPDLFIRIDLPTDLVLPEYFVATWNSWRNRSFIEENAKTTSGIWKVNQQHVLGASIAIPSLPEQQRIVSELKTLQTHIDTLKELQADTTEKLEALLPAILDRAFKGVLLHAAAH